MSRPAHRITVSLIAVALILTPATRAAATPDPTPTAPDTSFSFVSAPGDFIGNGTSKSFVASADVSVSVTGTNQGLTVSVHDSDSGEYWYAKVVPGRGDTLHPGSYPHAERAAFRTGRAPGLDVFGDGRGCNQVFGSFAVDQIAFAANGAVTMADVSFVQHCESASAPPLRGTIHLAALPLSYTQRSEVGDYIGGGVTKTYRNSTSTFSIAGSASYLSFDVSGLGDDWHGILAAPTGSTLTAATTYRTARSADATHAGLDISGDGRGCNTSYGTLTIVTISLAADGSVSRLLARFVQHCGQASAPALRGTLHYLD